MVKENMGSNSSFVRFIAPCLSVCLSRPTALGRVCLRVPCLLTTDSVYGSSLYPRTPHTQTQRTHAVSLSLSLFTFISLSSSLSLSLDLYFSL